MSAREKTTTSMAVDTGWLDQVVRCIIAWTACAMVSWGALIASWPHLGMIERFVLVAAAGFSGATCVGSFLLCLPHSRTCDVTVRDGRVIAAKSVFLTIDGCDMRKITYDGDPFDVGPDSINDPRSPCAAVDRHHWDDWYVEDPGTVRSQRRALCILCNIATEPPRMLSEWVPVKPPVAEGVFIIPGFRSVTKRRSMT